MSYIVTFYSHFGAIRYKKLCAGRGIPARVMPVPRDLSSSCGTCVRCGEAVSASEGAAAGEIEQIVRVTESGYEVIYRAENG